MVIMDEISTIKTFFESHQVHLSTPWLTGCINWCKEENPANSIKDLQLKVYEQWLLLDLRDVEVPCLPPDLSNSTKYILKGNYCLQMMKVMDISKPKHWQLQKIRNSISKNSELETESSKRVLQLTLTDGVQEVEAMEYKPVQCLNLNLTPGIKIRLMGPITVRRGRLMLENRNVKILGGEVDELIIPNAAENVLATILKLPLNPKPNVIEESLLTANTDILTGENTTVPAANSNTIRNNIVPPSANIRNVRQEPVSVASTSHVSHSAPKQNRVQMVDIDEEEELRIAAEIDMLMEVEEGFAESSIKTKKARSKTPDLFDDADINDSIFENIDMPPTVIKTTLNNKTNNDNNAGINTNIQASLELENDIFESLDIDAHLNQIETESKKPATTPPKPPVLTIEKLLRNIPNISNGKFKIKAKFVSVTEKLNVANDEYYLVIKVEDETGELTARLHSDIVSDFARCPLTVFMGLKTGILEQNKDCQRKFLEALSNIRDKLSQLNHIIEVHVNVKEKFPVIVNILE